MSSEVPPLADPAVRRVAFVRLRTGLGDLLASVPAMRAVRRSRPDLHVTLVTFAEMAAVVARQAPYVDDLLAFPGHPAIPERPAPGAAEWDRFVACARAARFDLAVQAYGALPGANEVTAALGATRVGGFFAPGRWAGDTRTHLPYPHRAHEVDRHLRLVTFLGAEGTDRSLEFPVSAADRADAHAARLGAGLTSGRPLAVVHPGATAASRRWPPARFAAVADGLTERGFDVAVTGTVGEATVTSEVVERCRRRPADLTGRTTLGGFAALLEGACPVVSGDTGTVQLAIAVGAPTVTVYLAGDPTRWAGDRPHHRAVAVDVGCNPCGLLDCPIDFRCATSVTPAAVLAEIDDLRVPR